MIKNITFKKTIVCLILIHANAWGMEQEKDSKIQQKGGKNRGTSSSTTNQTTEKKAHSSKTEKKTTPKDEQPEQQEKEEVSSNFWNEIWYGKSIQTTSKIYIEAKAINEESNDTKTSSDTEKSNVNEESNDTKTSSDTEKSNVDLKKESSKYYELKDVKDENAVLKAIKEKRYIYTPQLNYLMIKVTKDEWVDATCLDNDPEVTYPENVTKKETIEIDKNLNIKVAIVKEKSIDYTKRNITFGSLAILFGSIAIYGFSKAISQSTKAY